MQSNANVSSTPPQRWSSRAGPSPARPSSSRALALFLRGSRRPVHPGRFLESRFMQPGGITQDALARAMGVSRRRVNELIRGRRAITPDSAIRLALFFGTDASLWIELQTAWDMHRAWQQYRAAAG